MIIVIIVVYKFKYDKMAFRLSLTCLLALNLLFQAIVNASLQHLFDLLSAQAVEVFNSKLLTHLLASDEFALYS